MSGADAWLGIVILLAFGLYLLGGLHELRRRLDITKRDLDEMRLRELERDGYRLTQLHPASRPPWENKGTAADRQEAR